MRKLYPLLVALFCATSAFAQLSGPKTIPGDYATIAAAVTAVNSSGVGAGGVTFNINAGHTETSTAVISLTATGTAANPIVFQKTGVGANPKITRTDAGSLTTSTLGGQGDAVIQVDGSDYVTFNGVDVTASQSGIEYGYYLRKASATDACKNLNIQNGVITMNKGTSAYVVGIYVSNNVSASTVSSATGVTVTANGGRTESVSITGNTIQNVHTGIIMRGFAASSPYALYDQNNTIGASGQGNIIQNVAGGTASTGYGVYLIYQNGANVSYNTIDNAGAGGSGATSTYYGIFHSTGTNSTFVANNNTVTSTSASSSSTTQGIRNDAATGDLTMNNNAVVLSNNVSSSGTYAFLYNGGAVTNITMNGNSFGASTFTTTATGYLIYNSVSYTGTANIQNNTTTGAIIKNGSATFYGYYDLSSPTGTVNISGNIFDNIAVGGTSTFTVINVNTVTSHTFNAYNNTITNITGGTGPITGISSSASNVKNIYGNTIRNLTSGGTVIGIVVSTGATSVNVYKNKIADLSSTTTTTNTVYGISVTTISAATKLYNNIIGNLTAPTANSTSDAIRGISITGTTATTNISVLDNTIYLNAASTGTDFNTSALYQSASTTATSATLLLQGNIIVNTSTPSGSGTSVAFRRSSGTASSLANYNNASDRNVFYAGTPGSSRLIYSDGTATAQTLADYKNGVFTAGTIAPRDANSITTNPSFLSTTGSSANFLHINPAVPTQIESGGLTIAGITDDFDNNTRQGEAGYAGTGTAPDIGADEFEGSVPALMVYTSSNTVQQTGYAYAGNNDQAILRIDVVTTNPTNPLTLTQFTVNANGTTSIGDLSNAKIYYTGSPVFNTSSLFGSAVPSISNFTISGSQALAEGNNYFWLVYDLPAGATVGNSIDGEVIDMIIDGITRVPATTAPAGNKTILGPMSGNYNVGAAQTFPNFATITAAVSDLNLRGVSGPVTFTLMDANYSSGETYPIVINSVTGASAANTITIKPASGVNAVISGTVNAGSIIKLNGADYITIEGSNNATTSRNLTIINNTTTTSGNAVVWMSAPALGNGSANNTIRNTIIEGNAFNTSFMGVFIGGNTTITATAAGLDNNNSNNIINNLFRKTRYGIVLFGYAAATPDINNVISNNTFGTAVAGEGFTLAGILADRQSDMIVSGNEVQNIKSSSDITGIKLLDFKNGQAYNNIIHNLSYTGGSTVKIYGMLVKSSTYTTVGNPSNARIYNNSIYDVTSNGTSTTWNLTGLLAGLGYGDQYYFNSIHLAGQLNNSSSGLSAAFANGDGNSTDGNTGACTNCDIRNNAISLSGTSAGGNVWAYYTSLTSLSGTVQDYNLLRSAGTGATNNTGRFNGNNYTSLATWQAAAGVDNNSIETDPMFNSNTNLVPLPGSPLVGAGTAIAGITTDILGAARNANPTIGAYEQTGDVTGPVIAYTAIGNTLCVTNISLSATITDAASGVNSTAGTKPRVWFKKSTNANVFATNDNTTDGWKYTEATNAVSPFNFVIDYSLVFGGVSSGETVQYFIAAQDIAPIPNVSVNSGTLTGSASSVALTGNFPVSGTINSYNLLSGALPAAITIGAAGDYPTLSGTGGLFSAINAGGLSANTIVQVLDASITETGAVALNTMNFGCGGPFNLTIKPAAGVSTVLSGSNTTALIDINGADNVTFDGSNSGSNTQDMIIRNTATSGAVIRFINEVTGTTIKNIQLEGGNTSTSSGLLVFSTASTGTTGNSGNTVNNNIFRDRTDAVSTANAVGIYSSGTAGAPNGSNTITGNSFQNFTNTGINVTGTGAGNNWQITGNSFFNNLATAPATAQTAITVSGGNAHTISGNFIGGSTANAGGTAWINTGAVAFTGITFAGGTTTVSNITGNTITNISQSGTGSNAFTGINITAGLADVTSNTIGHANFAAAVANAGTGTIKGIYVSTASISNISQNLVANISQTNVAPGSFYGIDVRVNQVANINRNKIYSVGGPSAATGTNEVVGIYLYNASGNTNPYNIVNNMVSLGAGISNNRAFKGIDDFGYSGNPTNIFNNSVYIAGDGTGTSNSFGYVLRSSGEVATLRNNILVNNRTNSSTGKNYAIGWTSTSSGTFSSNYNNLFASGGIIGIFNTTDAATLNDWATAVSGEANSINQPVSFVSSTDLHLNTDDNCALDGTATPLGSVTTDIDGQPRIPTPDMGADQFNSTFGLTITNPATVCTGSTVDLTVAAVTTGSTSGGTFTYWNDAAATSALAAANAVGTAGTYYIKLVKGSCSDIKSVVVSMDAATVGGTASADQTICSGSAPANIALSGQTGNVVKWQRSTVSDFSAAVTDINVTAATLNGTTDIGNLTATTYFRAVVKNGVCNEANSSVVTVTVDPASVGGTASSNQTLCSGATPANISLTGNTGNVVRWERSTTSGFTAGTVTTINVTSTTLDGATDIGAITVGAPTVLYFRAVVKSGVCNEANSSVVSITVDPPSAGGTASSNQTICSGTAPANITLAGNVGNVVKWEMSPNAGFGIVSDINVTSTTLTGTAIGNLTQTTYFRAVVQSGVCTQATSSVVTITVDPVSVGGTVSSDQTICSGSAPANLTLAGNTGNIVRWERSTTAGFTAGTVTNINVTAATLNGTTDIGNLTATTYFRAVVQSGVCNEAASSAVTVTVSPATVGGTVSSNQTICTGTAPANITLSGQTGSVVKWQKISSAPFSVPVDIANTTTTLTGAEMGTLTETTFFRAVVKSGTCSEAFSSAVTITVSPATVAGTASGAQTICIGNAPISDLTLSGNTGNVIRWESAADAGFTAPVTINVTGTTLTSAAIGPVNQNSYFRAVVQSPGCTALNSNGILIGVNTTVNNATALAGVIGGGTVCANYDVATSNNYLNNCDLIATVTPGGASPVSGNISACVKIDGSVQIAPTGEPYVQRHFDILPASNATAATSTITLYFKQSEFDAFNLNKGFRPALPTGSVDAAGIANLRVTQYNGIGTAPGNYSGTAVQINPVDANITYNAAAGRWSVTFDVTGSGGFYVHTGSFILPVTLLEFSGQQVGNVNRLNWKTATEISNKGFELERSADGTNFSSIGFIATKAENGNSTATLQYSFDDVKPFQGSNYYRLKQVDKNGSITYSKIILLSRKVMDITLTSVYPNPATRDLNVVINSPRAEKVTLIVTDLTGKLLVQQSAQLVIGENMQKLDVLRLAAGSYFVKAVCANGCETAIYKFIKQ